METKQYKLSNRARNAIFIAYGLVSFANATSAFAVPANVNVMCTGDSETANINLVLDSPLTATYKVSQKRSEVLFTFDRSFVLKTSGQMDRCSPLLNGVQSGFNTLVVNSRPNSRLRTTKFPNGYGVEITTARINESSESAQLALERARLLYKQGEIGASVKELSAAAKENPDNSDLLYTLATYRSAAGDQRGAARAMRQWGKLEPQEAKHNTTYRRVIAPFRTRIGGSFESIDAGDDFHQERAGVNGSFPLSAEMPDDTVTVKAETNNAVFKDILNPNGKTVNAYPNTERYEVNYLHPYDRDQLEVGVSGADYTLGGHARYEFRDDLGATFVKGQLAEPNWDYASTVAFEGRKSSFGLGREQRINSRVTMSGEIAENRFGLTGISDAANSFSVNGNVSWVAIEGDIPVQLNYMLDGDYFHNMASRPDNTGAENEVFSTQSSEFHVFTLGASKSFEFKNETFRPFSLYAFGGYSFDRLGEEAPQTGAGVRGGWWDGPDFSLEAGRSFSTVLGTSDAQTRILATINWSM